MPRGWERKALAPAGPARRGCRGRRDRPAGRTLGATHHGAADHGRGRKASSAAVEIANPPGSEKTSRLMVAGPSRLLPRQVCATPGAVFSAGPPRPEGGRQTLRGGAEPKSCPADGGDVASFGRPSAPEDFRERVERWLEVTRPIGAWAAAPAAPDDAVAHRGEPPPCRLTASARGGGGEEKKKNGGGEERKKHEGRGTAGSRVRA